MNGADIRNSYVSIERKSHRNRADQWPAGVAVTGHASSDDCPCGPTLKPETAGTDFPTYVHHDLT